MTKLTKKLTTDILVSGLLSTSSRVRGLLVLPIITAELGVSAYGAYMQLLAVTGILGILSTVSLKQGYVKFAQEDDVKKGNLFYTLVILVCILAATVGTIISIYAIPISRLTLNTVEYSSVFETGALLIPVTALANMGKGYFRGEMRIKTSSGIQAARDILRVIAIATVVYGLSLNLTAVIQAIVIAEILLLGPIYAIVIKDIGASVPSINPIPNVLNYSIWMTVSSLSNQLSHRADRLMLGYFIGASAVGIYSIGYGLAALLLVIISPIRNTFFPEFSRLISTGEKEKVGRYTENGIQIFMLIAIPGIVGLYFVSEPLIRLFATASTDTGVRFIVTIIAIGILLRGIGELYATSLFAAKSSRPVSLVWSGSSFANIVLNIFLIPFLGVVGAALATLATYAISSSIVYLLFNQKFSTDLDLSRIIRAGLATLGMAGVLAIMPNWNVFLTIIMGVVMYFVLLILLRGIQREDLKPIIE